jgi:hypothetical protein
VGHEFDVKPFGGAAVHGSTGETVPARDLDRRFTSNTAKITAFSIAISSVPGKIFYIEVLVKCVPHLPQMPSFGFDSI